jgi:hypothetical protein
VRKQARRIIRELVPQRGPQIGGRGQGR